MTCEDMMVAPKRVVIFRCSRKLRDRVNWERLGYSEHVDVNLL